MQVQVSKQLHKQQIVFEKCWTVLAQTLGGPSLEDPLVTQHCSLADGFPLHNLCLTGERSETCCTSPL